jgi:hypothetical protein
MDDGAISVATEVEVSGYAVNLEETSHAAALLFVDISDYLLYLLVVAQSRIVVDVSIRNDSFLEVILDVDKMDLKNVLNI